jgi:hypothetical protein
MTHLAADFTPLDAPAAPRRPGGNRAGDPCPNQCTTDNVMPVPIQPTGGPGAPTLWCPACHEDFGRA